MAVWAKFKLFYDTMLGSSGSTLTASSTESSNDHDVDYIYNMLETNSWKAANANDPSTITYDAGAGNTKTVDYLAIAGHNLNTAGAYVVLQNSSDNFVADTNDVIALAPTDDNALIQEARITCNGGFESWTDGGSAAPDGWGTHYGGEAISAQTGKVGTFAVRIQNAASTAGGIKQEIEKMTDLTFYKGKTVTLGCWVKCSTASRAKIRIGDGVSNTASSYHTGGGDWEFLTVTKTMDNAATVFYIWAQIDTGSQITADFDDMILKVASSVASTDVSDFVQVEANAQRYWRLLIGKNGGLDATPEIKNAIWGDKTELDYVSTSFDPYEQNQKANVNLSYGGYVTGIHEQYKERKVNIQINDADSTLYTKIKNLWDDHGLKNLFVLWESANNPTDAWLMRLAKNHRNPLNDTGVYRNINLELTGRRE